jgi:hypothetical protein
MKTFLSFLAEETKPHETEDGSVIYSHSVGPHTVQTHFYPRVKGGKTTGYDVHFTRHSPGSQGNPASRQGMSKMSAAHRVGALAAVVKSVHHFIKTKKPAELHGEANSTKKRGTFHKIMTHIGKRTGGSVDKSAAGSVLKFK